MILEALTIVGGIMQVVGSLNAGAANAEAQRKNALLAEYAAQDAEARGSQAAAAFRGRANKVVGAQRAAYGASGVDATVGSPADVARDTRLMGELDALTAMNNAAREAWGYRKQGSDFDANANQAIARSAFDAVASATNTFTTQLA